MKTSAIVNAGLLSLSLVAACATRNSGYCEGDGECLVPGAPFCDVEGEFAESDHQANTCTARPQGCPVERCGCDPGVPVACVGDQLSVCDSSGTSATTTTCNLGCASSEPRCLTFEPSNDLGAALGMASDEPDVTLPPGVKIDTSSGVITNSAGGTIAVRSVLVTQGATSIRAFIARSFVIDDATVTGDRALAAVALGSIVVKGRLDASAEGAAKGPGGQELSACVGAHSQESQAQAGAAIVAPGAGGGGNASVGGAGGGALAPGSPGGAAVTDFVPLAGGCQGGALHMRSGPVLRDGGGGGGAVQLVSLEAITLTNYGFIDVGGGGGRSSAGGGSGGTVILEAPRVEINGPTTGITANGGAGGGCDTNGPDGSPTISPALGPQCTGSAGNGGTASMAATGGAFCVASAMVPCPVTANDFGGGGGAVGRLRIGTRYGTSGETGSPILSAATTLTTLTAK